MEAARESSASIVCYELERLVEGDLDYAHLIRAYPGQSSASLIAEDEFIDVVTVDEGPHHRSCFRCSREYKTISNAWVKCSREGCLTVLCPRCLWYPNGLRRNTPCIICGKKYVGGPRTKFSRCALCCSWCCKNCLDSCRHIVRSRWSQHNFEI